MKITNSVTTSQYLRTIVIIAACLCIGFLLALSLGNALLHSQDFQWSGARALLKGMDPFHEYLSGNRKFFIKSQAPNYLHIYYIIPVSYTHLTLPTNREV